MCNSKPRQSWTNDLSCQSRPSVSRTVPMAKKPPPGVPDGGVLRSARPDELVLVAVAVRLESKGPAIFRQQRLGRYGIPFHFYKFRGMHADADQRWPELEEHNYSEEELPDLLFHPEHDPRVTRVGRFIRRTSLDELPNLWNVLRGDMSIVGPRPEIPEMIPYYGDAAPIILSVKPGVTSLAKVTGRDELTFSKTLAPGLRLGYAVADERTIRALVIAKQAADLHTGNLSQRAVARMLESFDYDEGDPCCISIHRGSEDAFRRLAHRPIFIDQTDDQRLYCANVADFTQRRG